MTTRRFDQIRYFQLSMWKFNNPYTNTMGKIQDYLWKYQRPPYPVGPLYRKFSPANFPDVFLLRTFDESRNA